MVERTEKVIFAIMFLAMGSCLFSVGYSIGYYEGVKDTTEETIAMLEKINDRHANITSPQNTVFEPWWNASWTMRRSINSETKEYLYYTSNCSEKQINDFIKGEYYKKIIMLILFMMILMGVT